MDANQNANYASIVLAELNQRKNFEALYKEIFNISEMPMNDPTKDKISIYKLRSHNEAYKYFRSKTSIHSHRDGVKVIWEDISLIRWLCAARFVNTPKYEFIKNTDCSWSIEWDRSKGRKIK